MGAMGLIIMKGYYRLTSNETSTLICVCLGEVDEKVISESPKLKRFGAQNQFKAALFVTVSFIGCSFNAMELMVQN